MQLSNKDSLKDCFEIVIIYVYNTCDNFGHYSKIGFL